MILFIILSISTKTYSVVLEWYAYKWRDWQGHLFYTFVWPLCQYQSTLLLKLNKCTDLDQLLLLHVCINCRNLLCHFTIPMDTILQVLYFDCCVDMFNKPQAIKSRTRSANYSSPVLSCTCFTSNQTHHTLHHSTLYSVEFGWLQFREFI